MTKQEALSRAKQLAKEKDGKFDVVRLRFSNPDEYYAVPYCSKDQDDRYELIAIVN